MFLPMLSAFLLALLFGFHVQATIPSPRASIDLICHTSHASECYPKELPAGLHVRMNLETGRKEAKLNIIEDQHGDNWLDITVVDQLEVSDENQVHSELNDQEGHEIKCGPNLTSHPQTERELFEWNLCALKPPYEYIYNSPKVLEVLEDLCHDIHWGLALTKERTVIRTLLHLIGPDSPAPKSRGSAASVLGTAIQNNPEALSALLSHRQETVQIVRDYEIIAALEQNEGADYLIHYVYLLSNLCQDQAYCSRFVDGKGPDLLISIFDAEEPHDPLKDKLRGKIANLVLDRLVAVELLEPEPIARQGSGYGTQKPLLKPNNKTRASLLKPWCRAFLTRLKEWDSLKDDLKSTNAIDSVRDAYAAVRVRLELENLVCEEYI